VGGVSDGAEQVTARSHDGIPVDIKRNEPKSAAPELGGGKRHEGCNNAGISARVRVHS